MTNVVKSALFTFVQAFIGVFGISLLGWMNDIMDWASDLGNGGNAVPFPDREVLIKAVVSAVVAGAVAVVTAGHTALRNRGVLGEAPVYRDKPVNP